MNNDLNHLKLLGICHTIWGVLAILLGLLFGIVFMAIGGNPDAEISGNLSPAAAHGIFLGAGITIIVLSAIYGVLMMAAGRKLRKQRGYGFCFFVSILDLIGFPSLVLGIFALVVLMRPTVKELFKGRGALPPITTARSVSPVA